MDRWYRRNAWIFSELVAAALLLAALQKLPYFYYVDIRIVVTLIALAMLLDSRTKKFTSWKAAFIALAVVYNPLLPLHLTRQIWQGLNIAGAAIFVGHFVHLTLLWRAPVNDAAATRP